MLASRLAHPDQHICSVLHSERQQCQYYMQAFVIQDVVAFLNKYLSRMRWCQRPASPDDSALISVDGVSRIAKGLLHLLVVKFVS